MSYNDAVRVAIANHLNRTVYGRDSNRGAIHPNDIIDIQLHWDNGDRPDPTYGGSTTEPTLEVRVTLQRPLFTSMGGQLRTGTELVDVSVELVFTALLRSILETGL